MKSRIPFFCTNLLGLAAFAMPFFVAAYQGGVGYSARTQDAYWILALFVPLIIALAIAEAFSGRLDAKFVALLGVLCACAALLRLPISFAGANFFFIVPLVGGFVFGPTFGFMLGSLGMATSALLTGGIGPWLPFQMFAAGWVGAGAGCLVKLSTKRGRGPVFALAAYGLVAAFFYGGVTSLYFWPLLTAGNSEISWQPGIGVMHGVKRYLAFYTVTSFAWDMVGGITNALVIALAGGSIMRVLNRFRSKFQFQVGEDLSLQVPPCADHIDSCRSGETDNHPSSIARDPLSLNW